MSPGMWYQQLLWATSSSASPLSQWKTSKYLIWTYPLYLKPLSLVLSSLQSLIKNPSSAFLWAPVRYLKATIRSHWSLLFCCWSRLRGGPQRYQRAGGPLLWRKDQGTGLGLLGEEKAPGRPHCSFPVVKGNFQEGGEWLFTWTNSDRIRWNGFKLKEWKFGLDVMEKFFTQRTVRQRNR